ncbi:oligosaccharide flippase family protein [Halolamina salina]|uniref:Polysaccharide biosynthesis C-terminal domain-containing protein n=1 Tax=Halolamina salina TaxID=1220023 RepID=A0ABD6B2S5_9EURY
MPEEQSPADISPSGEATKATLAKFAMAAIGFAGNIYFARELGPNRIGGFYLFVAVAAFLGRPMAGMGAAVQKRASEAGTSMAESVGALGLFGAAWFVIVTAGTIIGRGWLQSYTGIDSVALFLVLYFATEMLFGTFVPVLQARGQIGFSNGMDALRSYIGIPIQLVLVTLGFGVPGLIVGLIAANVIAVPIAVRELGTALEKPSKRLVARVADYARFSVPNAVVGTAYGRFDTFLLGALLSQAVVGDYGVAARMTLPAIYVASSVSATTFVRVSEGHSRDEAVHEDVTNSLAFASVLSVPLFFGGAVVATPLVNVVYGSEYAGAAAFLVLLGLQRIFQSQTQALLKIVDGLNRPDYSLKLSAVALGINVPLGIVLVQRIGGVGVVIATVLVELFRYLGAWRFVAREVPEASVLTTTFLKQLLAGVVMGSVVYFLREWIDLVQPIELAILLTFGAVTYGCVLLLISQRVRATATEVALLTQRRLNML